MMLFQIIVDKRKLILFQCKLPESLPHLILTDAVSLHNSLFFYFFQRFRK